MYRAHFEKTSFTFFTFILLLSTWIGLYLFRISKAKSISEFINSIYDLKIDTKENEKKFLASTWSSDIVAMTQNIHLYDEIHPFLYTLEGGRTNTGKIKSIWNHEAQEIYIWTLKTISPKTKIIPTIFRWENDFEKVSDAIGLNGNVKIRDYHIQQILKEIDTYNYDGIDIDYEGMTCDKKKVSKFF